jgi:hypothetical protein
MRARHHASARRHVAEKGSEESATCSSTITMWELQIFEKKYNYNTLASPFFDQTGGFGRLGPQLGACNISFLVGCCGIPSEGSRMARSAKQGVAKLSHDVSH